MPLLPDLGFAPDLDSIPEESSRPRGLLFINYPNNPTGAVVPDGFFDRVISSPSATRSWSSTTTPIRRPPTTGTWLQASSPPPAQRTSVSRSSPCPRATT